MTVLSDLSLQTLLMRLVALLLILPVGGIAAALAARLAGDPGPAQDGRLSPNPIVHLDALGAAAFALFGMGWIKPLDLARRVPVALAAVLGQTVAVLALGILAGWLQRPAATMLPDSSAALGAAFLTTVSAGTATFAAFNLVPLLPLAAGYILETLLPLVGAAMRRAHLVIGIGLIVLLATGYPQQIYAWKLGFLARLGH